MAAQGRPPYCRHMERLGGVEARDDRLDIVSDADPAVRDAAAIVARATADALAASEARERYAAEPMAPLEADPCVAAILGPDEQVLAVRHAATFDRRHALRGSGTPLGLAGDLYVTTLRIVLIGRVVVSIRHGEVEEIGVSGERLLLVLRDGSCVSVQTPQPRLLRVEIGAARAAASA